MKKNKWTSKNITKISPLVIIAAAVIASIIGCGKSKGAPLDVMVPDGVKEVVIGDEVKIITCAGKEYSASLNEVASDDGIGSYTSTVEREKAKQEDRVLPAFPDAKFKLTFERTLPEWVKVYGGYAVTDDGKILPYSKSTETYSGVAAEIMEVSAGMDPLYLDSNAVDLSRERYQVVKIIFEADGKMYESYLFGKKGGAKIK